MDRRRFLGWLGIAGATGPAALSKVAIYTEPADAEGLAHAKDPQREALTSQRYVIRNEGNEPFTITYTRDHFAVGPPRRKRNVPTTILLPGEELTVTAQPWKV